MGLTWAEILAVLTSVCYGVASAVVPVVNAEAYVVVSQLAGASGPVHIAVGIGIGQTIGKVLLFLAVRHGKNLRFIRHRRARVRSGPTPRITARLSAATAKLLALVGQERWGLPITGLAAVAGLPPLYAVALLAGASKMRLAPFALVVLAGRTARFVLIATGSYGLHAWFG